MNDEWATPKWLFDIFDAEFHFTLDACAQEWNAKVSQYCSPVTDGLTTSWKHETVWLNPPFSTLAMWMRKAYVESLYGATVVCLVPCTPDRHWWSDWVENKASRVVPLTRSILPSGRVHFEQEDGTSGRAPFPSAVVVYGDGSALEGLPMFEEVEDDRYK